MRQKAINILDQSIKIVHALVVVTFLVVGLFVAWGYNYATINSRLNDQDSRWETYKNDKVKIQAQLDYDTQCREVEDRNMVRIGTRLGVKDLENPPTRPEIIQGNQ
jgi:hypothetical protein